MTLDQTVLEKTKFDKVLPRLLKRGDNKIKELSQKILDQATALAKKKSGLATETRESSVKERTVPKPVSTSKLPPEPASRQSKEAGKNSVLPPKKPASAAAPSGARTALPSKTTGVLSKRPSGPTVETKPAGSTASSAVKPKANHVAAKPSAFFSSLHSASKKPGTSNAAIAAQQKDGKVR